MSSFTVSAPGKVIIFGEHLAVYSKPAIAAALDLRCYLQVIPLSDLETFKLEFTDIDLVYSWKKLELPWERVKPFIKYDENNRPIASEELIPEISAIIGEKLAGVELKLHFTACHCFLYMLLQLCGEEVMGHTFRIKLMLPIGAGLGSLALTAVCLASGLAVLGGRVQPAGLLATDKALAEDGAVAEYINDWSFVGEMCFHGNPSGIDNAVATFGGAVMFQRRTNEPSVRTTMRNFPPIKLVLTNTKVPRLTAELVAGVGEINRKYPKTADLVLLAMEHLATDAYHIMIQPVFGSEDRQTLRELVNVNHGLLVALGVSHPSLEQIKMIGDRHQLGATKLTGAGGGGCAITLVNDDVEEEVVLKAMEEFKQQGFETYETNLGGKGVGYLAGEGHAFEDMESLSNDKRWKYW